LCLEWACIRLMQCKRLCSDSEVKCNF